MVRAPCCEKMGLKKGPWSPVEDQILINHIHLHGHANWRALPKQAGLLRCGKSCRLRWTNYLRPDIKRGNYTNEEEETIIHLHHKLGNRWSAIAAQLPGRTDNEIKNVWHTHLKKRVKLPAAGDELSNSTGNSPEFERHKNDTVSSHSSCSSSIKMETEVEMDEDFWSGVLSAENSGEAIGWDDVAFFTEIVNGEEVNRSTFTNGDGDDVDFWLDLLCQADLSLRLPDI